MRKALSRDKEKKSVIPLSHPVRPDELEWLGLTGVISSCDQAVLNLLAALTFVLVVTTCGLVAMVAWEQMESPWGFFEDVLQRWLKDTVQTKDL